MINLKVKTNSVGIKRSITALKKSLTKDIAKGLERGARDVSKNIQNRFKTSIPSATSKESQNIYKNIKVSSPIFTGDSVSIGIGNVKELDEATKVVTEKTGKVYHLWRILELGWGMKGGFKSRPYLIEPVNANYLRIETADGLVIYRKKVLHTGGLGKFFILDAERNWYKEDRVTFVNAISVYMKNRLAKISYKGQQ